MQKEVIVGYVGKAHGLAGEVAIRVITDEPEIRFAVGAELAAGDGGTLRIAARRWHSGVLLMKFEGVNDRSAAQALRSQALWAELHDLEDDDEFHDVELIGLTAKTSQGDEIGPVLRVLHFPAQDLLEIKTAIGSKLVPFVRELVPEVDVEEGCLTIAEIPGLLDEIED
ncbi:MAG: ribosome maturation factor RimM [Propionibacteriaceae bacterium]|jgi:16S rRNA processing protein RimM|nr:ribosome maturation factor RimM [Propionibacteriaceae bacterium]